MNGQRSYEAADLDHHMPMIPCAQLTADTSAQAPAINSGNARLEKILADLLTELGVDVREQHFQETPKRVARLYRDLTRGYRINPAEILKSFSSDHRELVVVSGITFQSLCPHHMLIYRGTMHLGYIPNGRIVGLSKIPRLIQALAARLIVQEELVAEIADTFMEHLQPLGCVVKATGTHDCVAVRGVRAAEASMTTIVPRGVFKESFNLMEEFHRAVAGGLR
jgi:GTP cyclohydrolase I